MNILLGPLAQANIVRLSSNCTSLTHRRPRPTPIALCVSIGRSRLPLSGASIGDPTQTTGKPIRRHTGDLVAFNALLPAPASVPEPSTFLLALLALVGVAWRGRHTAS